MLNQSIRLTAQAAKRGFTLIELFVAIAIIAILVTILFPVFAKARESAPSYLLRQQPEADRFGFASVCAGVRREVAALPRMTKHAGRR